MKYRLPCMIIALTLMGAAKPSLSQGLADPMRPPVEYMSKSELDRETNPNDAGGQILILSKGRNLASINGEIIALGGKYRDGRLAAISEDELLVKGSGNQETIKLYSSINKTMLTGVSPAAQGRLNKKKKAARE